MSERFRVAAVRARRARRITAARLLGSRLLRWRYGQLQSRTLAIAPQDIRPRDRMFWAEIESGFLGLAGSVARIGRGSPFDCAPPGDAWARELHGFAWLRHIDVAVLMGDEPRDYGRNLDMRPHGDLDDGGPENAPGNDQGNDLGGGLGRGDPDTWARRCVLDWLARERNSGAGFASGHAAVAHLPDVRARRIVSWLSAAMVLLDGSEPAEFDAVLRGLSADVTALSAQWRLLGDGRERLTALTALTFARVAFEEEDDQLDSVLAMLTAEIDRQVLPDGGHISRNPAALIDVLLDWLPLKSCFDARGMEVPPGLLAGIERAVGMVRFLRLGDGGIARFNGMGVADASTIATLLAYDERPVRDAVLAPSSRYARLDRGGTIVIVDAGPPPPIEHASEAGAGVLALEASVGKQLLFVNMGAPGPTDSDWRAVSRATASHTGASLGEMSSAQLVRVPGMASGGRAMPAALSGTVRASVQSVEDGVALEASHEGYVARYGLVHRRVVGVDLTGAIAGADHFEPRQRGAGAEEVPFSVHFHLHPSTSVDASAEGMTGRAASLVLTLADGSRWRLEVTGAATSIEESTFLASSSGPQPSLRVVARGISTGGSTVAWTVRREGALEEISVDAATITGDTAADLTRSNPT